MNIKLVFDDWRKQGVSVYETPEGIDLTMGDLHSGSTFAGTIELDADTARELESALAEGYQPVFRISK